MNRVQIEAFDKWADIVEEARLAADEARGTAKGKVDAELLQRLDAALAAREEAVGQLHAVLERKETLERRVDELEAQLEESATKSADKCRRELQEMQVRVEEAETEALETRLLLDSLGVDCESQVAGRQECEREAAREKGRLNGEIVTLRVELEKARDAAADDQGAQMQLKSLQEALEDVRTAMSEKCKEMQHADTFVAKLTEDTHQHAQVVQQLLQEAQALQLAKPKIVRHSPHTFELPVQQLLSRVPSAGAGEMQALKRQLEEEAIKVCELKVHADKLQQVRKSQSSVYSGFIE